MTERWFNQNRNMWEQLLYILM